MAVNTYLIYDGRLPVVKETLPLSPMRCPKLKVFVDFTFPGSSLALEPTLEFIDSHQIETTWHPFQNWDRDLPQAGADADTVLSHEHARQASIRRSHEHYAALRGLDLRLD